MGSINALNFDFHAEGVKNGVCEGKGYGEGYGFTDGDGSGYGYGYCARYGYGFGNGVGDGDRDGNGEGHLDNVRGDINGGEINEQYQRIKI